MPVYRVTLKEVKSREWPWNPFAVRDILAASRVRCRVWEIEAKDKAEVRQYYDEAKALGLDNVCGFELESIVAVPQHVCGLQGYNPAIDPRCPGCEARADRGNASG